MLQFADYKGGDKIIPWEVKASFKGAELVGMHYRTINALCNQ